MGLTPFFRDDHLTVYQGDCREVMAAMAPESVHCVVTSPPYWGLRDYGTATWVGGDEGCDHKDKPTHRNIGFNERYGRATGDLKQETSQERSYKGTCGKCGATQHDLALGLEPTPEAFVANMVDVFREVRRVLRKDGTLWLNLGDSYAAQGAGAAYGWTNGKTSERDKETMSAYKAGALPPGLKPKDLVGIPWRVAFALQADGWYLRSDIIWSKPNPMPESVTDRPTKAHEYLFLLTKSARYYYDADAVREDALQTDPSDPGYRPAKIRGYANHQSKADGTELGVASFLSTPGRSLYRSGYRNLRSVWSIATEPYPGAHFATFPRKLVEPCVKAGCPEGGTVLDPFAGSGTTGMVAQALGRRAVLIDLNGEYLVQAMARNAQTPLGLVG